MISIDRIACQTYLFLSRSEINTFGAVIFEPSMNFFHEKMFHFFEDPLLAPELIAEKVREGLNKNSFLGEKHFWSKTEIILTWRENEN